MRRKLALIFLISAGCFTGFRTLAQDTLQQFSVTTRGNNKILISWVHNFPKISQISIQRSLDSTRNFKTILSVPDPSIPQNGFVDGKPLTNFMFYRLFVVLDSGKYFFTKSTRPVLDTSRITAVKPTVPENNNNNGKRVIVSDSLNEGDKEKLKEKLRQNKPPEPEPERFFVIKRADSIVATISETGFKKFRDSVVYKTKDTLLFKTVDTIQIKPFVPKEVYKPSEFVYAGRDGNVTISLADATKKKYSIKFFDEQMNPLFEIAHVKESPLFLDKAIFLHSGWFRFEIYEDGKLKEKHWFFIPKEF